MPLALAVIGAAGVAGLWLGGLVAAPAAVVPTREPAATPVLPSRDVPGADIANLPRFPGSVRVHYAFQRQGASDVAELTYVASADVDDVRSFYRRTFRELAWEVVELDVRHGEWLFLVASGRSIALVEIEPRDLLVEIRIELEAPGAVQPAPTPTPTPAPQPEPPAAPPPPPPPPADDDDDDGWIDD